MTSRWLMDAAAFLILWFALALLAAPFIGAWLRRKADEQSTPAPDWPPEYEPGDDEAQRIAEQFAEAAAEEDDQHGLR